MNQLLLSFSFILSVSLKRSTYIGHICSTSCSTMYTYYVHLSCQHKSKTRVHKGMMSAVTITGLLTKGTNLSFSS